MWEILFHGAKHYMHLLLAASPSTLFEKTAFGMSVVLMGTCDNLSAGFQRLNYPLGQPGQAAEHGASPTRPSLRVRSSRNAFHQRAVFVVGTTQLEPTPIVHFDAVYVVTSPDGTWTIKGIKPLWAQTLTDTTNRHYKMHFRPNGHVPTWLRFTRSPSSRRRSREHKRAPPKPVAPARATPAPAPAPADQGLRHL